MSVDGPGWGRHTITNSGPNRPRDPIMALTPVVRYMVLCDDARASPNNPRRTDVYGLMSQILSHQQPPFPVRQGALCAYLALTECRGPARMQIVCVSEDTGQPIFGSPIHTWQFDPADPLAVIGLPFRMSGCPFPAAGMYSVQFWYNGVILAEQPLLVREGEP